jgi:hypothetical protein
VEALLALIGIVIVWSLFGYVIRVIFGTARAAARAAVGKGSFSDNFQAAVVGMKPMEVRLLDGKLSEDANAPLIKEIQVKGLFPIHRRYQLEFITSLFDDTSGKFQPVISGLDIFQERRTRAYQHTIELGSLEPGVGFIGWVRVGVVIPQIIEAPYSGNRKLVAILRLVDSENKPDISQGFHQENAPGLLWQQSLRFDHVVSAKGYLEAVELREKARKICVQIALAIAMWDGTLEDRAGELIKSWIQKVISGQSTEEREKLKTEFNDSLREAYERIKRQELSLTELTEKLNAIDDSVSKYETVELCFDILGSSGIDSSNKARVIDLIAKALKLDSKEIESIRDIKIVGLNAEFSQQVQIEDLLGIDRQWSADQIKRHLRSEFQKWNDRVMALPEGAERNNAQKMLDAISEARKKYG